MRRFGALEVSDFLEVLKAEFNQLADCFAFRPNSLLETKVGDPLSLLFAEADELLDGVDRWFGHNSSYRSIVYTLSNSTYRLYILYQAKERRQPPPGPNQVNLVGDRP